jgi:hypothetical protein
LDEDLPAGESADSLRPRAMRGLARPGRHAGASALTFESPDADIKAPYEGASAQERSVFLSSKGAKKRKYAESRP